MSRLLAAMCAISAAIPGSALAQQVYGPSEGFEGDADTPVPIVEEEPCETQAQEDGVILVCRELTDSERYMSPIPKPVESDRAIIPGLTDPPCWVTNPGPGCIRFGWAPEPAIMVDLSVFPEPLSSEEAAQVVEVESETQTADQHLGERIAIDLSEDD